MKKRRFNCTIILVALLALMVSGITASASTASSRIDWKNYDEGVAMAKAEKKKIFLYFHAAWCGYCHKMDASTFKDAKVIDYLNNNYITIKVDSDKETKIASTYGVRGLPTSWFLEENSDKLSSMPGYIDAKRLLTILKYVKTESYEKMNYRDFEKSLK